MTPMAIANAKPSVQAQAAAWAGNGTHYTRSVSCQNTRIDFYVFDESAGVFRPVSYCYEHEEPPAR